MQRRTGADRDLQQLKRWPLLAGALPLLPLLVSSLPLAALLFLLKLFRCTMLMVHNHIKHTHSFLLLLNKQSLVWKV